MTSNTTQQTVAKKADAMVIRPHVDIYENQAGATLYADLPGVAKDNLSIDIDENVLTVKGEVSHQTPNTYKAAHNDIYVNRFERRFTLGDELDSERVEANLKQGVLTLFIPRAERHKPRKIDVKVA